MHSQYPESYFFFLTVFFFAAFFVAFFTAFFFAAFFFAIAVVKGGGKVQRLAGRRKTVTLP